MSEVRYYVPKGFSLLCTMFRYRMLEYPIWPRGCGKRGESHPYFTEEDLNKHPKLREIYEAGLLDKRAS